MKGIAVVSDLHLVEHYPQAGRGIPFFKSENTKPDDEIVVFVEHARRRTDVLVINGDFVDFDLIPRQGEDDPTREALARLELAYEHHRPVFDALKGFLESGGALALVMGNHDLDWFRPAVRARLLEMLCGKRLDDADARFFEAPDGSQIVKAAAPKVFFYPRGFSIDGLLWAEHAHFFDPYARWPDIMNPWLSDDDLYYPVGSLVNRYITLEMWSFNPFVKKQVLGGLKSYAAHYFKYHLVPPWRAPLKGLLGTLKVFTEAVRMARRWEKVSGRIDPLDECYLAPVAASDAIHLFRTLWLDRFAIGAISAAAALGFAIAPLEPAAKLGAVAASILALPAYELVVGSPAKGRKLAPYL